MSGVSITILDATVLESTSGWGARPGTVVRGSYYPGLEAIVNMEGSS